MKLTEELRQLKSLALPSEEEKRQIAELEKKLPCVFESERYQNELLEQINSYTESGIPSFLHGFSDEAGNTFYFLFEEEPKEEFLGRYLREYFGADEDGDPKCYSAF